jgi:hypothetical protein
MAGELKETKSYIDSERIIELKNLARGAYEFFLRDKKAQLDKLQFSNFGFLFSALDPYTLSVGVSFHFPDSEINYDKDDLHNFKGVDGFHTAYTAYCKNEIDLLDQYHAVLSEIANGFLI